MLSFRAHKRLDDCTDQGLCELIRGPKRDAEAAFTELFNRYSSRIHAYIYRILNQPELAEDVFQETFLRFHEAVKAGRPMTNVSGFLFTVAKNQCLNHKKTQSRRQMLPIQDFDFPVGASNHESEELLQLVATALDLLDFDYREAFVLREYDGLSFAEVAEVTGASLATAKIRVHRAKNKIKQILKPYLKDLLANQ